MSRAAIFSFMPILTKILPESITNIERGRFVSQHVRNNRN